MDDVRRAAVSFDEGNPYCGAHLPPSLSRLASKTGSDQTASTVLSHLDMTK